MKKDLIIIFILSAVILYASGAYINTIENNEIDEDDDESEDKDTDKEQKTTLSTNFQPVPLPTSFNSYDINKDSYIDLNELAEVSDTSNEEASKPFGVADQDENNLIDEQEFKEAPWNLEGDVSSEKKTSDEEENAEKDDDTPGYVDEDEDSQELVRK